MRHFLVASLCLLFTAAGLRAETARITGLTAPADGTYKRSEVLMFTANFSVPVFVTGAPRLPLLVGNETRFATWTPPLEDNGGAMSLSFVYTPEPGDVATNGVAVGAALDLNGGVVRTTGGDAVATEVPAVDTHGVRLVSLAPPTPQILGVAADAQGRALPGANGTLVLRGTADGDSMVTLSREDIGIVAQTKAEPNGAWSIEYPRAELGGGTYRFTAIAQNRDGLVSASSAPLELTIVVDDTPRGRRAL
jgi:hypothetical protein